MQSLTPEEVLLAGCHRAEEAVGCHRHHEWSLRRQLLFLYGFDDLWDVLNLGSTHHARRKMQEKKKKNNPQELLFGINYFHDHK